MILQITTNNVPLMKTFFCDDDTGILHNERLFDDFLQITVVVMTSEV